MEHAARPSVIRAPVRVRADHVEAIARLVLAPDSKGHNGGGVAREVVLSTALEAAPRRTLAQLLEARGCEPLAGLLCMQAHMQAIHDGAVRMGACNSITACEQSKVPCNIQTLLGVT